MRLHLTTVAIAALSAITFLSSAPVEAATAAVAECTSAQQEERSKLVNSPLHMRCMSLLEGLFESCSDECLPSFKSAAARSPSCLMMEGFETTYKMEDDRLLKKCEQARATSTVYKYIPKPTPGLANCTNTQYTTWERKYGYVSPTNKCVITIRAGKKCSDECRAMIVEGVEAAPECRFDGDYSWRELKKDNLVGCLTVRGEDLKTNALLQGTGNSTASTSTSTNSSASSNATKSDANGSGKNSTASTKDSTAAPAAATTTAPTTSRASALVLSAAVAVASVAATMFSLE